MSKELIRKLNDTLRSTFEGGRVMMTSSVNNLPDTIKSELVREIRTFNRFDLANDPYEEHDFGGVEINGQKYFWKIDYYDHSMESGSEEPSDPKTTMRVLTIMHANEY